MFGNERDLCIFKNITKQRNVERIPVICNQIKKLWIKLRSNNEAAGFHYVTAYIQSIAYEQYNNGGLDPFYWEEDRWYDFIDNLIDTKEDSGNSYLLVEQLNTMTQIIRYFENYWMLYPDLRLQQILNLFDELVGERAKHEILSVDFWKNIMVPEQLKVLNNSIFTLQDNIKRVQNEEEDFLAGVDKDKYTQILQTQIFQMEQRRESLAKEYGIK